MKLRYKYSEILLILGLILCLVVIFYVSDLSAKIWENRVTEQKYYYHYEYGIQHTDIVINENTDDFASYTIGDLSPISFQTMSESIGSVSEDTFLSFNMGIGQTGQTLPVSIYLKPLKVLRLEEKFTYNKEYCKENGIPMVYIGKSVLPYTYEKSFGTCLSLGGIYAVVSGVLQCDNLAGYDETILLDYSSCGEQTRASLEAELNRALEEPNLVKVLVASKKQLKDAELEQMEARFLKNKMKLNSREFFSDDDSLNRTYSFFETVFSGLIYVFVIANLVMICNLWFLERKAELKVRKLCGMNNAECIRLFAKDFLRLEAVALIVFLPVMIVLRILVGSLAISRLRIAATVISMVVLTFGTLVFMIWRALRHFSRQGFGGIER